MQGGVQYPALCSPSPAFASRSSNVQLGFLLSLYLLSRICTHCACLQLFLVLYRFFVFCCSRRGVSKDKHCSKGSQVPTCLNGVGGSGSGGVLCGRSNPVLSPLAPVQGREHGGGGILETQSVDRSPGLVWRGPGVREITGDKGRGVNEQKPLVPIPAPRRRFCGLLCLWPLLQHLLQ